MQLHKKEDETDDDGFDINNIHSVIYGEGLNHDHVKKIFDHLLLMPIHPSVTKTRHKNFIRSMIHLVAYVLYLQTFNNTTFEDMTSKGSGYLHNFETDFPYKNDSKYKEFFTDLFTYVTTHKGYKSGMHPTLIDFEKWAGLLYNHVCVVLKHEFKTNGIISDDDDSGICPNWNNFLISMGINLEELSSVKK